MYLQTKIIYNLRNLFKSNNIIIHFSILLFFKPFYYPINNNIRILSKSLSLYM